MPRLIELNAEFLRWKREDDGRDYFVPVSMLSEAHGIRFICPKAFLAHPPKGIGAHSMQVYFKGSPVPAHLGLNQKGETVRWTASGTGINDLTLSPSIQEEDDTCKWHGFVTNGSAA